MENLDLNTIGSICSILAISITLILILKNSYDKAIKRKKELIKMIDGIKEETNKLIYSATNNEKRHDIQMLLLFSSFKFHDLNNRQEISLTRQLNIYLASLIITFIFLFYTGFNGYLPYVMLTLNLLAAFSLWFIRVSINKMHLINDEHTNEVLRSLATKVNEYLREK